MLVLFGVKLCKLSTMIPMNPVEKQLKNNFLMQTSKKN
jgi:hypothetical protein